MSRPLQCTHQQMNSLGATPRGRIVARSACLAAAVLALLTAPVWAEVDCNHWNTRFFFRDAEAQDIDRCINAGSNPNEHDSSGSTPLHLAAVHGGPVQIRALIDRGADLDDRDAEGRTPLHLAAMT